MKRDVAKFSRSSEESGTGILNSLILCDLSKEAHKEGYCKNLVEKRGMNELTFR